MENSEPIAVFDRLAGLETEYAIRFQPQGSLEQPSRLRLYQQLLGALRRRVPAAEAMHFKEGVFLATGGAVWYETERMTPIHGLVEGSTPECRGPRQLVTCQRAQDRLLSESAAAAAVSGDFTLLKNDRDALGNTYGAQENYEARLAAGWSLLGYRMGLAALLPAIVLAWLTVPFIVVLLVIYLAAAGVVYLPLSLLLGRPTWLATTLFGEDLVRGQAVGAPLPIWMEGIVRRMTQTLTFPLAAGLWALCKAFAFRKQRRMLTPFLVSRAVFCGAGSYSEQGMQLADKAPGINSLVGMGGMIGERPIFVFGHLFKMLCSWREWLDAGQAKQRLQIGLGDSNMCQTAEYLRVGVTMLVLDAIEAGEMPEPPVLRNPLDALHTYCSDTKLTAEADCEDGRSWTAIELQRFYLDACRQFLAKRPHAPPEAFDVLGRWEWVLDQLVDHKLHHESPDSLIGIVDWVTKQSLLDQSGGAFAEKKKIDLRYHELSANGYHQMLADAGQHLEVVAEDEILRAMRNPPPDSPATTRGRYIREFAQTGAPITANWKCVQLGGGIRRKLIKLRSFGVNRSQEHRPNAVRIDGHQL